MRYHRKLRDVEYTDEQLQALATELAESKRMYDEEAAYENSCNKRCRGLLSSGKETVVESDVAKSLQVP